VICESADKIGAFSHGYTYSGHPLGCAAAMACLDIVERENLTENAARIGQYLIDQLRTALDDHPLVGEVRGVGMLAAIEFVADRTRKRRFDPALKVGAALSAAARKRGLITRAMPHGEILGFAPPLITSAEDVDQMVSITVAAVGEVLDGLVADGIAVV
jgi:L-2,4-diaminobutyrate transaminase